MSNRQSNLLGVWLNYYLVCGSKFIAKDCVEKANLIPLKSRDEVYRFFIAVIY